jgi:hypothetical protein
MIMSIAHANTQDAERENLFGAWSNLVVGSRPEGLVNCYLLETDESVQVVALWRSIEDHNRAIDDDVAHPAYAVFEAAGLDPVHSVHRVFGQI